MVSWNYRVIEFVDLDGSPYRQIHEVHYEKGKPEYYAEHPAHVMWVHGDDPKLIIELMAKALDKPVLVEADFS